MKRIIFVLWGMAIICMGACSGRKSSDALQSGTNAVVVDTVMGRLLFPTGKYGLAGGDGAISIAIDKTTSLWLWGDSFIGRITDETRDSLSRMVFGNVFVLLDGDSARTIYGGTPGQLQPVIPSEPVEGKHAVYWPHHGFVKDGLLHVFASNIVFGGGGMWDFHCRAIACFRLTYPGFEVVDRQELASYPVNKVAYGYGLHEYKGHYYFYGNLPDSLSSTLHAGRARLVDGRLRDWEYFDGAGWTADPSKTSPLKGIDVAVSSQFSVFRHHDTFILLNQERGIGTNDILK